MILFRWILLRSFSCVPLKDLDVCKSHLKVFHSFMFKLVKFSWHFIAAFAVFRSLFFKKYNF